MPLVHLNFLEENTRRGINRQLSQEQHFNVKPTVICVKWNLTWVKLPRKNHCVDQILKWCLTNLLAAEGFTDRNDKVLHILVYFDFRCLHFFADRNDKFLHILVYFDFRCLHFCTFTHSKFVFSKFRRFCFPVVKNGFFEISTKYLYFYHVEMCSAIEKIRKICFEGLLDDNKKYITLSGFPRWCIVICPTSDRKVTFLNIKEWRISLWWLVPHVSNSHTWMSLTHVSNSHTWMPPTHVSNSHTWMPPPTRE